MLGDLLVTSKKSECSIHPLFITSFPAFSAAAQLVSRSQRLEQSGRIDFNLYTDLVSMTAKNFAELCHKPQGKGYKGSTSHRIIPEFMIQGGDFTNGEVRNMSLLQ